MNKKQIEDVIGYELRDRTLEEILEDFDLSATDAFLALYNQGLIDDEILDSLYTSYEA